MRHFKYLEENLDVFFANSRNISWEPEDELVYVFMILEIEG